MLILSIDPGTHYLGWVLTTPDQVLDAGLVHDSDKPSTAVSWPSTPPWGQSLIGRWRRV